MKAGAKTAAKVTAKAEKDAAKHALKVREVDEALRSLVSDPSDYNRMMRYQLQGLLFSKP